MPITRVEMELGGKLYSLEVGKVAGQANGAVMLQCGDTMIMATACMSAKPREGMDFFPLTCDYEERKYAVGKIPGGFVKRGGRPSEKAVLTSRLIDRPIRPLFPDGMRNDVQVIALPLSMEPDVPADVLAVVASSAALAISDIPWNGPLGCARVCRVDGEMVVNPSLEQIAASDMEFIVAGKDGKVLEIEFEGKEIPESDIEKALDLANEFMDKIIELQLQLVEKIGKQKAEVALVIPDADLMTEIAAKVNDRITDAIRDPKASGKESAIFDLRDDMKKELAADYPERVSEMEAVLEKLIKKQVRRMIIEEGKRADGRAIDELRQLGAEVGLLPRVHGSGLFNRGQTQVLTTLVLGSLDDSQKIDTLEEDTERYFMHFYNFPPYSVGEVRPLRGAGRREVGHGALAEKALRPVMPTPNDFPYTVLLTSEVLESNGSTSMASTCGCTLALMDAGVPIKAPVAGISIGLITDGDKEVLLTDIQGLEDFTGDMDFKVAGTTEGITAIQVDTKTNGLSREIVLGAMQKAKDARFKILDVMVAAISIPRVELSQYAPRVLMIEINPERIGEIIGPGGKVIKKIEAETGAKMSIEQDGRVFITCADADGAERAKAIVEGITKEVKPGEIYKGKINRLESFGAFVEILPNKDGLLHISQWGNERVNRIEDVCALGDIVEVKVLEVGDDGKIRLSRKAMLGGGSEEAPAPPRDRDRDHDRDRGPRPSSGGGRGPRPSSDRPTNNRSANDKPTGDDDGPKVKFRPKQ